MVLFQLILVFFLYLSLIQSLLFYWRKCYMNKHVNKVLQQRIKSNKKTSVAEPQWSCHTLLRPELRHTAEPHTPSQTQGLYFLNNICLSFSSFFLSLCPQEDGINKPIRIQIINHYLDPLPVSCVCWQRLQITNFVYYFAWLLMVWFSCV